MRGYGYDTVKVLVTDIDPDTDVKMALNRINAAERDKKGRIIRRCARHAGRGHTNTDTNPTIFLCGSGKIRKISLCRNKRLF